MAAFDNGVSSPGGMSYAAPLLNFAQFGNWANDYQQGVTSNQHQQLNQQLIADEQRKAQIAQTFRGGLPIDPRTGQPDYAKAAAMLAAAGDPNAVWNSADAIAMQSAGNISPLLSGGAQPAQGPQGGAPASVPQQPPQTPASPRGDAGSGTIASLVTDRLPGQDATTGQTIGKIASTMGVDPNATLTPGQLRRAQGLLQKYAPADSAAPGAGEGGASFKDRFAAAGPGAGSLPPSANAVAPAPPAASPPRPQAAPGAGGAVAASPQGGQPSAPGQPLVPQVPLPKGFTDPQAAILALRAEAVRLSANPRAAGQVKELNDYANRIEASIQPVKLGQYDTYVDPRTGQPVAEGPGAAMLRASETAGRSPTLDADAEAYRQTGKLPPNMGRGLQGAAEARAIRQRAVEQEVSEGGNPAEWPSRWQNFSTQATGKRVLEQRAAGLSLAENEASSLIPRVREISAKVSRTNYPNINSLILAAQKGAGGQDVIKLGIAIESLVPVYARVLKPVGQVGQGDMARAHDILDKAWSDGQINAALDQMQVELKSARSALDKTMNESDARGRGKKEADTKTSAPDSEGWVTLPNGARIQEVK